MSTKQKLCTVLEVKYLKNLQKRLGRCSTKFALATPFSIQSMQWRVWYNLILLRCSFAAFEGPSSAGPWGGRKVGAGSAAPLWSLHLGLLSAWFIHLQIQFPPCTTLTSSASDLAYPSLPNWALCPTEFHLKCSFLTFMRLSFLIDPQ